MAKAKFTAIKAKKPKAEKRGGPGAKYPTTAKGGKAKQGKR